MSDDRGGRLQGVRGRIAGNCGAGAALWDNLGSRTSHVGFVVLMGVFAVGLVRVRRRPYRNRVVLARLGDGVGEDVLTERPLQLLVRSRSSNQ